MTRKELRQQGEATRECLFGKQEAERQEPGDIAPGFRQLMSEVVYGAVWNRPGLAIVDRMICTLAALCAVQRLPQLRRYVGAALNIGIEPRTAMDTFIQIGIYAGFSASEEAIEVAAAVCKERGVVLPANTERSASLEALSKRGQEILQFLHGARGQQGYASPENPFTGVLYPMAIQYGYGEIWDQPGLDLRQRALCAVAGFTALRMESQLKKFGQSALNAGLDKTAVIEAVVQTAPFSGFAPALNALNWLSEVL